MNSQKVGSAFKSNEQDQFTQADYVAHIRRLTEEVQQTLDQLPLRMDSAKSETRPGEPLRCAKRLERERQQRLKFFPDNLVRDPAWPLLLELYRCRAEGVEISVTSLSLGMNIPSATGHRWIDELNRQNMAVLSPSSTDARRTMVAMTDSAFIQMDEYLRTIC